jgi:type II restriction enzyme
MLEVFRCIGQIKQKEFSLEEAYHFASELKMRHPDNSHIKDKIRQQLQYLRDRGIIEFKGNGRYRKLW